MTPDWQSPDVPDFADLDRYASGFKAEYSIKSGLEVLANGDYDCTILSASMERVKGDPICRITLTTEQGVQAVQAEWTCWLNKQTKVNRFAADMAALGINSHLWGPALGREIPAAVAKLAGVKFRGHKSSRRGECALHKKNNCEQCPDDGTVFHDMRILCRISGQTKPPVNQPVTSQVQAPAPQPASQLQPAGGPPDDDVPF